MDPARLRCLFFAFLFTAAGSLAVTCDLVETVGNGTPAPAGLLPGREKFAVNKRRKTA